MGRSSAHNRMVGIHRIVLAFGTVYVRYDEAFGERYKIIHQRLNKQTAAFANESRRFILCYTYINRYIESSHKKTELSILCCCVITRRTLVRRGNLPRSSMEEIATLTNVRSQ